MIIPGNGGRSRPVRARIARWRRDMAKTRLDRANGWLNGVAAGRLLAIDCPVRMDDCETAEDVFGSQTRDEDLIADRICTAIPTGHRTWSSADDHDEHFFSQDADILD